MSNKEAIKIKNPSPEELETQKEQQTTGAEAISKPKNTEIISKEAEDNKQDFRCEMKSNYNVFEPKPIAVSLITGNKVYNGSGITDDGEIYIRRLTTKEESMIQDVVYKDIYVNKSGNDASALTINDFLRLLNTAIDSCIKSNLTIFNLPIMEKLPLIVKLISMSYGNKLAADFVCEDCGTEYSIEIDLNKDIIITYLPKKFELPKTVIFNKSFPFAVEAKLNLPLVEYEEYFAGDTIDIIKQLESIIVEVSGVKPDGEPITHKDIPDIINNLDKDDKDKIRDFIDEFSEFGTELEIKPMKLCNNIKGKCSLANEKVTRHLELKNLLNKLVTN